jgi:hypothetical protein
VKRALFLALWLPSSLLAAKGDLSSPPQQKMMAPSAHATEKPAPDTDKHVLHLQLKK